MLRHPTDASAGATECLVEPVVDEYRFRLSVTLVMEDSPVGQGVLAQNAHPPVILGQAAVQCEWLDAELQELEILRISFLSPDSLLVLFRDRSSLLYPCILFRMCRLRLSNGCVQKLLSLRICLQVCLLDTSILSDARQ